MSLASLVSARHRKPTARVHIKGVRFQVPDVPGAIALSDSVGQPIAGGSVRVINVPFNPELKMPIVITWGYNHHEEYAFHGFVVNPQRAAYPNAWTIQVKNILWIADFAVQKENINLLNNKTANEVIITLLNGYAGIPLERIQVPPLEQSEGVPWLMGTLTPILFAGVSPLQACIQICDALGYFLYADAGGVVRARQVTGAPSDGPVAYYQDSRDWLVSGSPTTDSDLDKIVTRVIVTGAMTNLITGPSGEMRAVAVKDQWTLEGHPYLPDGKHREMSYSNTLIEFVDEADGGAASCTAVAKRFLLEHSRIPFVVSARVKADPRLGIGMTVAGREPRIGLSTYRKFFVMSINRTFGGGQFDQTLTLDGGIGDEGFTTIPPPVASFIWTLHQEYLNGVGYTEVFLDGSPSKGFGTPETLDVDGNIIPPAPGADPMSTIQSWEWSDDSAPPQTASGKTAMFMYPLAQLTANITLDVTDVTGKGDTVTIALTLAGDIGNQPTKREISFAATTKWYVTPDGGQNWRSETGQLGVAVPPISALGSVHANVADAVAIGLLASGGTLGGSIRATQDYLATGSELVNPGGSNEINFIWQHEKVAGRIWLAIGDTAWLSEDAGVTFFPICTPLDGSDITWIVNSVDDVQIVDFLAGPNMYTSWDAGAHLTVTLEGPSNTAIARNYTSGFAKHWVGYTNVAPGQSPLRSAEGDTAIFPVLTPEVSEIRALTMMTDRPLLVAVDQVGRIFTLDMTGSNAVHVTTLPN